MGYKIRKPVCSETLTTYEGTMSYGKMFRKDLFFMIMIPIKKNECKADLHIS